MSLDDLFTARGTSANVTNIRNLKAIQISIASPEAIREWSYGEVKKPETTVPSSRSATACSAPRSSAP